MAQISLKILRTRFHREDSNVIFLILNGIFVVIVWRTIESLVNTERVGVEVFLAKKQQSKRHLIDYSKFRKTPTLSSQKKR